MKPGYNKQEKEISVDTLLKKTRLRWSVNETIVTADWVWTNKRRPTGVELTELRDTLALVGTPRSEDAVSWQAFEFADRWGYATWNNREGGVQMTGVAMLFESCPDDMHRRAEEIILMARLRALAE
jgi:hypothetical protein